jgi:hypothetical protein
MRYTVIKSITLVSLVCMCAMSRDRAYKEERGGISYTLDLVSTTSCIKVSQDQLHDLDADCRVKVSLPSSLHVSDSSPQALLVGMCSHSVSMYWPNLPLPFSMRDRGENVSRS